MICEPIVFQYGNDDEFHFPDSLPLKTTVDIHNLMGMWMKTDRGALIITLDGRTVTYDRIGFTPEGHWVCRLRIDPATVYAQER